MKTTKVSINLGKSWDYKDGWSKKDEVYEFQYRKSARAWLKAKGWRRLKAWPSVWIKNESGYGTHRYAQVTIIQPEIQDPILKTLPEVRVEITDYSSDPRDLSFKTPEEAKYWLKSKGFVQSSKMKTRWILNSNEYADVSLWLNEPLVL